MPAMCCQELAAKSLPQAHPLAKEDHAKVQVSMALHEVTLANPVSEKEVGFVLHPAGLVAKEAIKKKGMLKLVPLGTASLAKAGSKPKVAIQHAGQTWAVAGWKQATNFEDVQCLVPFWWCKATTDQEKANMHWSHVSYGDIKVPCLQNLKQVEAGEPLHWLEKSEPDAAPIQAKKKAKAKP